MALAYPVAGSMSVGIQHKIDAASQFTGVAPGGVASVANGCNKFASSTTGGLFHFEQSEPIIVNEFYANFGAALGTFTLSKVNLDDANLPIAGEKFPVYADSAVAEAAINTLNVTLLYKQALMLETTGATAAMTAVVVARQERASNR